LNPSQSEAAIDERKDKKAMKRILHVDDSRTARLVNSMILSQRSNYELVSASDGKEALEKVHEARPDLILMNIIMPRMTGPRSLPRSKERQRHAKDSGYPSDRGRGRTERSGSVCERL
jgi:CheY-like chemotaxis protein